MTQRVLFLSNGHGEDLNASLILQSLRELNADIELAALPIVGQGNAYRSLGVPIVGPTQQLPSSGFNYIMVARLLNPMNWWRDHNPLNLIRDVFSGLVGLTWRQLKAARLYGQTCDLLMVTGDIVPILFAYLTKRPFVAFLVSTSSYYEGRIKLPLLALLGLKSSRCLKILTRDAYTADDLRRRGLTKAEFAGYPIMDVLTPTGKALGLDPHRPVVALLPGSRLPEASDNFALQLRLCQAIAAMTQAQFQAALVPSLTADALTTLADELGWRFQDGYLEHKSTRVYYHYDAFADILHRCNLVIGMAGTAVEQAVGLGKPVIQIIGSGPQFSYPFAEAQQRLLGSSVITIGKRPATPELLLEAAKKVQWVLHDTAYQAQCLKNGRERVGVPGGAHKIALKLIQALNHVSA